MNLYHAYELLLVHGAGTFVDYCRGKRSYNLMTTCPVNHALRKQYYYHLLFLSNVLDLLEGRKGNAGTKAKLLRDLDFMSLVDMICRWRNSGVMYELDNEPFVDHPKKVKLLEILMNHFKDGTNTRAMVFSSYRERYS